MADSCTFCGIISGEIPGDFVYQDDHVAAFRDISPKAPIHVVVIPKAHIDSLAQLTSAERDTAGRLMEAAAEVARLEGVEERGYRVVINTGPDSGSQISHIHLHVLAGWMMGSMG